MDCLFCKIIKGEIPCYQIYEDDFVIAFLDIHPHAPGHTLVIPKEHYADFTTITPQLMTHMQKVVAELTTMLMQKMACKGIRIVINYGELQEIKHFHIHLIPNQTNQETNVDTIWQQIKNN